MTKTLARTTVALADHLAPGETVLAAAQAQILGGTKRMATRIGVSAGLGGVVGAVVASRAAGAGADGTDDVDLGAALANGAIVAVTDRRVVILDVTVVAANPKDPVVFLDRAAITGVTTGEKRVMLVKLTTVTLHLGDTEIGFEIPKVAKRDADGVVAILTP